MSSTSGDRLLEVLRLTVDCFRRKRAPYMLIGAWALAVWGRPRATLDVDFLLMVNKENLEHLGDYMSRRGMEIDTTWREWNPMLRGQQLRLHCQGIPVDLLRPRDTHDDNTFKRRRRKRLEGRVYWIIAPEDFILQKLKTGRPRDFEDVLSVLERSKKELDFRYLRRWARRIGVWGELNYILEL